MAAVWAFCKTKTVCEPDEPKDEEEGGVGDEAVKKGHGGCGHIQPNIRKEGLKLYLQYKKVKDDDEVSCMLTPGRLFAYRFIGKSESTGEEIIPCLRGI